MIYANQLIKHYMYSLLFLPKRKDRYARDMTDLSVFMFTFQFLNHITSFCEIWCELNATGGQPQHFAL